MRTAMVLLAAGLAVTSVSPAFATDHTVLMTGDYFGAMFFEPAIAQIRPGDRIQWFNNVAVIHTATSGLECAPDGLWTTGSIAPGGTSPFVTFNAEGSFDYYCRFHCEMGMVGTVEVSSTVAVETATWGKIKALYRPAPRR